MSLDNNSLYLLVRSFSNSSYNPEDPLSLPKIQQAVMLAALQGQYMVAFEYPKAVSNALVIEAQGNVPDFSADVLSYYKRSINAIAKAFEGSQFVLSALQNAGGFKVSWSGAQPPATQGDAPVADAPATDAPAVVSEPPVAVTSTEAAKPNNVD